jgi:hypothetical protein
MDLKGHHIAVWTLPQRETEDGDVVHFVLTRRGQVVRTLGEQYPTGVEENEIYGTL